jgi:hypothetical protein
VRPAFGALELMTSLLLPIVAARSLSVEKERRSFGALCLREGSPSIVALKKLVAAGAACLVAPLLSIVLLGLYVLVGGSIDLIETATAFLGHLLHALLIASIAIAAAAWASTHAQAIAVSVLVSIGSWAIDASNEFAALAWLGKLAGASIDAHILSFDRGIFALDDFAWFVSMIAAGSAIAVLGARFDLTPRKRASMFASIVVVAVLFGAGAGRMGLRRDWTEQRRRSFPPAVAEGLRSVGPIAMTVFLDRDDSRRKQLEDDMLAKLAIARPDAAVRMPYDEDRTPAEGVHDDRYGTIEIQAGGGTKTTRSTSRKELTTLIFEAANAPIPSFDAPLYQGRPAVIEGTQRTIFATAAYGAIPGALAVVALLVKRRKR